MIDQGDPIYYDWSNITQDQFDDYRLGIYNSDETTTSSPNVTSTNETYNSKNTSDKADTPSSEIAFERAIVVMFNQDINGPISTFFTTTYNRRNISDITNPDLIDYKNPLHFQLKHSNLNQSERDLISTLFLCNREFLKTYGHEIDNNWSNVSPYMFDEIGENYGFVPIDRSMILPPTITPSKLRSSDSSKSVHGCAETTHFINNVEKQASNLYINTPILEPNIVTDHNSHKEFLHKLIGEHKQTYSTSDENQPYTNGVSLIVQQQQGITNLPLVSLLLLVEIDYNVLLDNPTQKSAEELPNIIDENTVLLNEDLDDISDDSTYMLAEEFYNDLVEHISMKDETLNPSIEERETKQHNS